MFSSSLRKRADWAAIVPDLVKTGSPSWKETTMDTQDVTFQVSENGSSSMFRIVLLSSAELESGPGQARVERLLVMNGGRNAAVVLLVKDEAAMEIFFRIQTSMVGTDGELPIIPISLPRELLGCIDALRRQHTAGQIRKNPANGQDIWDLASHCVQGKALSRDQVNVLTEITSGFKELAQNVGQPHGRAVLGQYLGAEDGERVVSFLTGGLD